MTGSSTAWSPACLRKIDANRGFSPVDKLPLVLERCERAGTARPDRSQPLITAAFAHDYVAQNIAQRGGDPRAGLEREIAVARRAAEIDGETSAPHERLAAAFYRLSSYQHAFGLDPVVAIDAAVTHAERAAALDPTHPWAHTTLSAILSQRALHAISAGEDPEAAVRAGLASHRRANEVDPSHDAASPNALYLHSILAKWRVNCGQDPDPDLAPTVEIFAECVAINPTIECQENMGLITYWRAEYALLAGQDARELLVGARTLLEAARANKSDYVENLQTLAALHLLRVRDALRRDEPIEPALRDLDAALTDCFRVAADAPECLLTDASRHRLMASLEAEPRRARPQLGEALVLSERGAAGSPGLADAHEAVAGAHAALARLAETPAAASEHHGEGLAACERGLAINPNHARLHGAQGALLVLVAAAAGEPAARMDAAGRAREALRRALELNPLLRDELAPRAAEAEFLAR